jgi:hypothetical protein
MFGVPVHVVPQVPQLLTFVRRSKQAVGLVVGHAVCVEAVRCPQVPFGRPVAAFEQPWQASVHALLQQTLSTQAPLTHSAAPPQLTPVPFFGTHAELEQ